MTQKDLVEEIREALIQVQFAAAGNHSDEVIILCSKLRVRLLSL